MAIKNFFSKIFSSVKPPATAGPNWFAKLDESRAPNVKQYLRGVRNYYMLLPTIQVSGCQNFIVAFSSIFCVERPYNYYNLWLAVIVAYYMTKYVKHNYT